MTDEQQAISDMAGRLSRDEAERVLEGHPCACMGPPSGVDTHLCHCALWAAAARRRLEVTP